MNGDTPLFSILIVAYNSGAFINETINSCLSQNFDNFEIIISDDNSKDNTWEIISSFNDIKIKKFKQKTNLGEYSNRNFCSKQAKGKFIIFIDGEDLLYPNGLTFLSYFVEKFSNTVIFLAKNWIEEIIYPKVLTSEEFLKMEYLDEGICALNFTQIIVNREFFLLEGVFDKIGEIKIGDVYLQYLLCSKYDSVIIPSGFSWWRRRKGQASENLIQNYGLYFSELNKFKYDLLVKNKFFFTDSELRRAHINFFGVFLRYLIKLVFYLRPFEAYSYLRKNSNVLGFSWTLPLRYKNVYKHIYSGEKPM
jgi:glycosyltransferase involved in cell wall biosynthesis